MKVLFKGYECIAIGNHYGNGRKSIRLFDTKGPVEDSIVVVSTINLLEHVLTSDDHIFVYDCYENEGMEFALFEAGIIEEIHSNAVKAGHVVVNEFKLTDKGLSLWKKKPKQS